MDKADINFLKFISIAGVFVIVVCLLFYFSPPQDVDVKPKAIQKIDGCVIYKFNDAGMAHYFTRCPDGKTTTDQSYTKSCGKSCSRTVTESITNE